MDNPMSELTLAPGRGLRIRALARTFDLAADGPHWSGCVLDGLYTKED